LPQTYGPYKSFLSQKIAKYVFKRATYILSRDREGSEVVKNVVGENNKDLVVNFCPDVAFVLDAVTPRKVNIEPPLPQKNFSPLIGFNVNGLLYNGGYTRDNMFGLNYDYKVFVHDLVEQLTTNTENHILLIPHTFGPTGNVNSDPDACNAIIKRLADSYRNRVHMVMGEYDQYAIKGIIGLCDFFIGSRMHACIAALSQGIPTVGVAYSRKFLGVFESIDVGNLVADARSLTEEEVINKILSDFRQRDLFKDKLSKIDNAVRQIKETFKRILG